MGKYHTNGTNSDLAIIQALITLVYAPTWTETYQALEKQQKLLLLNRASELLSFTITELEMEGKAEDAVIWSQYEILLMDVRQFGIEIGWGRFMQTIVFSAPERGT